MDDAAISLEQELTKKASFHRDAEDLVSKRMESITEAKERYIRKSLKIHMISILF